jgi:DNA repair exonuclease SbcCD ATPase subunit
MRQHQIIIDAYDKYNLMTKIISEIIIPQIEDEVNTQLESITSFTIKIYFTEQGISIKRVIEDEEIDVRMLSGFEHDILNVIFKIVMNKLNVHIRTNFIIFDEILASADDKHMEKLETLFEYIKNNYTWCLLITHLDALKKYFDMNIKINNKEGYSRIVVN